MVESSAVGRDGFTSQVRILLGSATMSDMLANRAIEEASSCWARRGVCDITGQLSFTNLQRLLIHGATRDGEVLVRHLSSLDNGYGYVLQVLDIDRLDTGYSVPSQNGRNVVRIGVELSSYSHPATY